MAILLAYNVAMKVANIAEFKNNLSKFIAIVEKGETVKICRRNIPIAQMIPISPESKRNRTRLGCGRGSVEVKGDLTAPMIPLEDWEMLGDENTS